MKFITTLALAVLVMNTCGEAKDDPKAVTYFVNSAKVPCEGVGKMQCLQIQKGEMMSEGNWSNFYGNIEGFDYQQGFIYKISVTEEKSDPATVPADASSIKYTLVQVLEKETDPIFRLHDIWALRAIKGEDIATKGTQRPNKQPMLEIFVADKRIGGNDGCNTLFGTIETLAGNQLTFSRLGSTKMMCPNMTVPNTFTEALANTSSYKVENLRLFLYNTEGEEILRFVKVD